MASVLNDEISPAALLAAIVDSSEDAIFSKDLDGTIRSWNKGAEHIFGHTAGEIVGRSVSILRAPGQTDELPGILSRIRSGEHVEAYETSCRRKDGQLVHVSLSVSPLRDASNRVLSAVTIARDITARRRTEESLRTEARVLEMVVSGAPLEIVLEAICLGAEPQIPGAACSVLLLDPVDGRLHITASPNLLPSYRDSLTGGISADEDSGPSGAAVFRREPVVVTDLETGPLRDKWRNLPSVHGYRAVWSYPVCSDKGDVIGVLEARWRQPRRPSPADTEVINRWLHLAGLATTRLRSQSGLDASEERFRTMVNAASEGFWMIDNEGITTLVNPRMAAMLGYDAAEIVRRPYLDFFRTDTSEPEVGNGLFVPQSENANRREHRIRKPDGETIWIASTANLLRDNAGKPKGVLALVSDITTQKKAEQEAHDAREQVVRILEGITDGFVALDREWRFRYINSTAERLYGQPRSFLLGNVFWDVHPDLAGTEIEQQIRRSVDEGTVGEFDSFYGPWGLSSRVRCHPLRDGGLEIYFLNITASLEAEEQRRTLTMAIEAERALLRAVLSELPVAVILAEAPSGRLLYGNQRVSEVWRHDFLSAESIDEYEQYRGYYADGRQYRPEEWPLARTLTTGETIRGEEIEILRGDGTRGTIVNSSAPIPDAHGAMVAAVVAFDDVTERIRTEAALRSSEEQYRFLSEAIPQFVWTADAEGNLTYCNQHWFNYTGLTWEQTLQQGWSTLLHPDDVTRVSAGTERSALEGLPFEAEYRVRRADGEYRWHLARARRFSLPGGDNRWLGTALDIHDRKLAEEAVHRTSERYRLVMQATNDAVWDWDLVTDEIVWNDSLRTVFGHDPPDLTTSGSWWLEHVHPDHAERIWRDVHDVIHRTGGHWSSEYPFRRADGTYVDVLDRGYVLRDSEGNAVRMTGSMLDLTDRKQARDALQHSEERYRALVEASSNFVWTWKPDETRRAEWWFELTAQPPEESADWGWLDCLHPADRERVRSEWSTALSTNTQYNTEYRVQTRNRTWRSFAVRGVPVWNHDGTVREWIGTVTEVTEQRSAERALRQSEERLRSLVNATTAVLFTTDAGGKFSQRQFSWEHYTGQQWPDYSEGRNLDAIHPEDRQCVRSSWSSALSSGEPLQLECRVWNRASRSYRHTICRAVPVRNSDGSVREWAGTFEDVHERWSAQASLRESNEALRRANAALEQFAYAAAHDLQEPVRNVALYTQLLRRETQGNLDGQSESFMAGAIEGARRTQTLIDDLLAYTRATTEGEVVQSEVNSADVLLDVKETLHNALELAQAEILVTTELPRVPMRPAHLAQILQNLIGNALKYRGTDPPKIEISATQESHSWRFQVRDNGQGISPEYHERIFKVFKRLHGREIPGTGIGLAICERIVAHYGGTIWVESELGKGATFCFTIPVAVQEH